MMQTLDDVVRDAEHALGKGRRLVVMLDYDGTLAPIAARPEQAAPEPGAALALKALVQAGAEVAIISGRGAEDVRGWLGVEGVSVVGSHGLELWWASGEREVVEGAAQARAQLNGLSARWGAMFEDERGVVLEQKPFGVALHYRLVERGASALAERARAAALEISGLRLKSGKCVLEAVPDLRWDKGQAAREVVRRAQAGSPGGVHAIYAGDDETDEDAFEALGTDASGVLVACEDRASAANARLASPAEVVRLVWELAAISAQGRLTGLL